MPELSTWAHGDGLIPEMSTMAMEVQVAFFLLHGGGLESWNGNVILGGVSGFVVEIQNKDTCGRARAWRP